MNDREQEGGPPGWKRTTLGEALPIRYGKARNEKYGTVREDTPVYGSSGRIDTFKRALTGGPSLIIGRKGTVGATYYCPEPCWPIDTVYFAEADVAKDLRFFKYLLDHLQLVRMDRSTAVPGLSRDDYNATEVFIPEFDQQRLIVAEIEKQFSRLDEAVANLKRVKANFKRSKAAILKVAVEGELTKEWRKQHPAVEPASKLLERILAERREKWKGKGIYKKPAEPSISDLPALPECWTWATLEQLTDAQATVLYGILQPGPDLSSGVPYVRPTEIENDRINLGSIKRTSEEIAARYRRSTLQEGDIILSMVGTIGKVALVPKALNGGNITQSSVRIRPVCDGIDRHFLAWSLRSPVLTHQYDRKRLGTAVPRLNVEDVRLLCLPVAPFVEQQRIVAEVERRLSVIEELESVVKANLARAARLRQSILSQAFSGALK